MANAQQGKIEMSETPREGPGRVPDHPPQPSQQVFGRPPPSADEMHEQRRRTWPIVVAAVVFLTLLGLAGLAGLAIFGVSGLKSSSSGSVQVRSSIPPPPAERGDEISCEPSSPESVALITGVLAPPADSLTLAVSYTSGRYEVLAANLVDAHGMGQSKAMWMIEDGIPYAAEKEATAYSTGIMDLPYEVSIGFQTETGTYLQQVADVLDRGCEPG